MTGSHRAGSLIHTLALQQAPKWLPRSTRSNLDPVGHRSSRARLAAPLACGALWLALYGLVGS
jgi:hypothetical protein